VGSVNLSWAGREKSSLGELHPGNGSAGEPPFASFQRKQPIIHSYPWSSSVLLFCAAFVAGAVNSVAGGGTLLTFPALVWLGVPEKVANATSTVALWPAALSSLWGYRSEMAGSGKWLLRFGAISLVGGLVGARLLLGTRPELFHVLVPYLILGASLLFMAQEPISRWLRRRSEQTQVNETTVIKRHPPWRSWLLGLLFQLGVAVYGGYFGAGIGILMLAALGLMGLDNIHRMNGVKNFAAMCINGVAAATFIAGGAVRWPLALLMIAGSILGGYGGANAARRLGPKVVRRLVIAIGLTIGLSMLLRGH
jgi:uncharacterized membrane protein YfcA